MASNPVQTRSWEAILYAALAAAPLLFGAVYPWAYGLLEMALAVALGLYLWRGPRPAVDSRPLWGWGLAALAGLVFWAGLQLLPLPSALVGLLAPSSLALWQPASLPTATTAPVLLPLSLYPFATANQGLLLLVYAAAAGLAAQITRAKLAAHPSRRPPCLGLLVFMGLVVAGLGIVQNGLGATGIYGFFTPQGSREFLGPYVNYNHFTGYLAMVFPLGLALVAVELQPDRRARHRGHGRARWVGLALVVMLAAAFMSRSRGGIFTLLLIMTLQLLVVLAIGGGWRINRFMVAMVLGVLLLLGVASQITDWSRTLPRFQALFHHAPNENLRWKLFGDVWRMSNRVPLTGTGLGTFAVAYPAFKTLDRQGLFAHAHNDYLELLAETGWPGLLLFLGFAAWVLGRGWGAVRTALARRNRGDPALRRRALWLTGCLGGVLALLIHGLVEFNLRVPANALTWFVLCGVTVGLAAGKPSPPPEDGEPPQGPAPAGEARRP